jgi:hypothetical protein
LRTYTRQRPVRPGPFAMEKELENDHESRLLKK